MLWWTVQNVVIAAALAGAVWVACRVGRIGPVGRHALWLVVLVKLLTPPLVVWPWAVRGFSPPADGRAATGGELSRADRVQKTPDAGILPIPGDSEDLIPDDPARFAPPDGVPTAADDSDAEAPAAAPPQMTPPAPVGRAEWVLPAAAGVWLAGAAATAALQAIRVGRMALRLRRHARPAGAGLVRQVESLAGRLGVRPVAARVVPGLGTPAVWALGRPQLLWPAELPPDLPAESVHGLIIHELAHVRRRDHWVGWLELAAGCVWWWNPLFWYVRHQVRENAELACDGWVVATLPGGRRAYAEGLLAVCECLSGSTLGRVAPVPALGAGTGGRRFLERRLAMILRDRVSLRLPRVGLLALGFLAAATLPAWAQRVERTEEVPVAKSLPPGGAGNATVAVEPGTDAVRLRLGGLVVAPPLPSLPPEAQKYVEQFNQEQEQARREVEQRIAQKRGELVRRLQELQDRYAREGRLDDAVAIRNHIRTLQPSAAAVSSAALADPGTLVAYRDRVGQTFTFEIVGTHGDTLWGGDVYTDDSPLAVAAVHAGVARVGQRTVVRVTILPGRERYDGSTHNGVQSSDYGPWQGSYRVEPATSAARAPLPEPDNLLDFRDRVGQTLSFDVTGAINGPVWGGDGNVYTDDSILAVAAVHAGVLRPGQRGVVRVNILPGRDRYTGSERNGVRSIDYGAWQGSYRVVVPSGYRTAVPRNLPAAPGNRATLRKINRVPTPASAQEFRGRVGESFVFELTGSAQPKHGSVGGNVWGVDEYTDDSSLAIAAVHAGVLKVGERGLVEMTILPGRDGKDYDGSTRNGVTSRPWATWGGSFRIRKASPGVESETMLRVEPADGRRLPEIRDPAALDLSIDSAAIRR